MRAERKKLCKDCGRYKPLSQFYEHPMMADGHLNSCKAYRKIYQRSRPYDNERERSPVYHT